MNELIKSSTSYQVKKENNTITIFSNKPIIVEDHFFDQINEEWVFAVKCYDDKFLYHIDYLFFNKDFKLLNVVTEDKGVNPMFLLAPDNTVWVSLSSTSTERDGEIVLPLQNRSRITKDIVRKDIGTETVFYINNQLCVYSVDWFNPKKYDKLLAYQFDKNGLYKTKKQYLLENIWNGYPTVIKDKCFVTYGKWNNSICTIHISEIDENGNIISDWKSKAISGINSVFLLAYSEAQIEFVTFTENHVDYLVFGSDGNLLSRNIIYKTEDRINLIRNPKIIHEIKAIQCISGDAQHSVKNVLLLLKNSSVDVYESENGYFPSLLNSSYILYSSISKNNHDNHYFNIVMI